MTKNIPTYKIVVNPDDESGVYAVSLVDEPAIEVDWIHLSKIVEMEFAVNKDKQMLFGPLLIPGKLIFRRDNKGNEYNITFDEETIQIIADKFNENKLGDAFNFQHSDKLVEAMLLQNWITGEVDKSQEFGFSLPKGTWFGGVKVKDEGFWLNDVKSGKVKGFSVEIKAGLELVQLNNNNIKTNLMEIKTNEGLSIYFDGELAVDTLVFLDEAMTEAAPEGDHLLEDGRTLVVAEGKVAEIKEVVEEPAEEELEEEVEEELEDVVETPSTETELALDPAEVLAAVQPALDAMSNVVNELIAKVAELEAKMAEESNTEMEELKTQVENLSKMAAVPSITNKSDEKRLAKEAVLSSKIKAFGRK